MPFGDGTGPIYMGPMSGRRGGFCAGFGIPGFVNFIRGRGSGRGMSFRRNAYPGTGRMRGRYFGDMTGPGRWW